MTISHDLVTLVLRLWADGDIRQTPAPPAKDEAIKKGFVRQDADGWLILTPRGHDLVVQRLVGRHLTFAWEAV